MLQKANPILSAAASPAFLAKGCVNVIELSSFKMQAGARWTRICDGVYARLEGMLQAKLGPSDLFVRLGDTAYLITMPTTDPDDVNAICLRIAFDLHMHYLGECDLSQIELNTAGAGEDDTLVLNRVSVERIANLADKAGILELIERAGPQKGNLTELLAKAKAADTGGQPNAGDGTSALKVEHQFVPIWSVANSAVTTYACEPKSIFVSGRPDSVALSQLSAKERLQVEMSCFQAGVARLADSNATGKRFLLAVPISFDVFGSPAGRMEILSACRGFSRTYRECLIFVIYDVPPGVAQTRLANMVCSLNPFARSVAATIAPTVRSYASYHGIGLRSVGFDLREFPNHTPFRQIDAEQLSQFARRSNLGTFLMSVRDKNALKLAQDANIQTLSGPTIAPACPEPKGMWRLTWAQTLAQPVVELWV